MEELLSQYALFFAETLTIVAAIAVVVLLVVSLSSGKEEKERLEIKKINDKYESFSHALNAIILPKHKLKKAKREEKKRLKAEKEKAEHADEDTQRKRMFVLNFNGDIKASAETNLAEEITALLTIVSPNDEVLLRLYSAGGLVHAYGLAASQLQRIKKKNIPLTVSVDKIAASGGYMMACVADRIIAAPFAILGSIGVVAQIPNFHRVLQKNDIDFELLTAGKYKRTLTVFGENTDDARKKFQQDIETTHQLFQQFVNENRGQVDLDKVATGEYWHGTQALELQLIDELMTSDDYLLAASLEHDIYELHYTTKKSLAQKFSMFANEAVERVVNGWRDRSQENQLL